MSNSKRVYDAAAVRCQPKTKSDQDRTQTSNPITAAEAAHAVARAKAGARLQIAMLLYPRFTPQDLIGPYTFLANIPNAEVHLVWKDKELVPFDRGSAVMSPTTDFDGCPRDVDVLFTPGGLEGTIAVMNDDVVLGFMADRDSRARYVTSVCTGLMILGCAGLLDGFRATSHWAFRELLPLVGATRVDERIVEDRNRITGGGVTSGLDFGLTLTALLRGDTLAALFQLQNEYDPQPPLNSGSPEKAGPGLTQYVSNSVSEASKEARKAIARLRQ